MYSSYLIRIWREKGAEPHNLQITAESVQSGQMVRFGSLSALLEFLQMAVDADELEESDFELKRWGNDG